MSTNTPTLSQVSSMAGGNVSPLTGLEGKSKTPTFPTIDQVNAFRSEEPRPKFYGGESLGLNPDEFPFPLAVGSDNVEMRARTQPIGQELAYGAGRLIATTATKFLEGIGYLGGIGEALLTDKSLGEALDNGWTNLFSNLEDEAKAAMPIYHTNKYNNGNILQQMSTLGFWMDDGIDGLAFLASAYLGSAGVSAIGKGLGVYGKLAKLFASTTKAARAGEVSAEAGVKLASWAQKADLATMSAVNSAVEAGFEAKDSMDSLIAAGVSREDAAKAAKDRFLWNMGILMVPNYITNSMIFGKRNPLKGRILSEKTATGEIIEKIKPLTKGEMAGAFAKDAFISMGSEGAWEENIQLAIQDYFNHKAQGKEGRGQVEGIFGNWAHNFITDEGQKNIALGAIIGLVPGGIGGVREAKANQANANMLHAIIGHTLTSVNTQLQNQDLYLKYDKDYEDETGKHKQGDYYINPKTGKNVLDPTKVVDYLVKQYYSGKNILLTSIFAEAGNNIMEDRIEEERISNLAYSMIGNVDGMEAFRQRLEEYAKQRVETKKQKGEVVDEKEIQRLKDKYVARGSLYKTLYDNINEMFAGTYNFYDPMFANEKDLQIKSYAQSVKDNAMMSQFISAVDQMFWVDKKSELQSEIDKLTTGTLGELEASKQKAEKLRKKILEIDKVIEDTKATYKSLLNEDMWQKKFDEGRKAIEKNFAEEPTPEAPVTPAEPEAKPETVPTKGTEAEALAKEQAAQEREEVQAEVKQGEENIEEKFDEEQRLKARKESVVDELTNRKTTEATGAETKEETTRLATGEALARHFGHSGFASMNLQELFSSIQQNEELNVVYKGKHGTLFIDPETNEVVFKDTEEGREYIIGKTTDEELFAGELTAEDLGIIPLKHTIFDMEVEEDGVGIIVQGRRYVMDTDNPTSVIEVEDDGTPIAVTLKDLNGVPMRFTSKVLVEELAYALQLIDEARETAYQEYLKAADADFPVVEIKGVKYYVYHNADGSYDIIKPSVNEEEVAGKVMPVVRNIRITNAKLKERILKAYFTDLHAIIDRVAADVIKAGKRIDEAQRQEIKNKIKDEITEFVRNTRPATEEESLTAVDPRQVSSVKAEETESSKKSNVAEKPAGGTPSAQPASGEAAAEKQAESNNTEKDIVNDAAEKKVEDEQKAKKKKGSRKKKTDIDDFLGVEPDNDTEPEDTSVNRVEVENPNGIKSPSTAVAWKAEDSPELDKFMSDPSNDLTGYTLVAEIDWDITDERWNDDTKKKEYIDKYINEIFLKGNEDYYDSLVDIIPIKLTLVDNKGNKLDKLGSMYYHRSDFSNIVIPARVRELQRMGKTAEYEAARDKIFMEEKDAVRAARKDIISKLLLKQKVELINIERGKGVMNQTPGSNRLITEVTNSADNGTLVYADAFGTLYDGNGNIFPGKGGKGNILWVTNETVNGTDAIVKMNVQKISTEHARILLRAYQIAATSKGGVQTFYDGKEVTGDLTVREVIDLLVFEGKITDQYDTQYNTVADPTLAQKTLYLENGILHYGKSGEVHLTKGKLDEEEVSKFIDHVTMHKNYAVPTAGHSSIEMGLGTKIKKDFTIGKNIVAKKGMSYQSFLFLNGMVMTDLVRDPITGRVFSKPSIMFEFPPKKATRSRKPKTEEKAESTEPETVEVNPQEEAVIEAAAANATYPRMKSEKDMMSLPAGSEIYIWLPAYQANADDTKGPKEGDFIHVIAKVVLRDGKPQLKIVAENLDEVARFKDFNGIFLSEEAKMKAFFKAFNNVLVHAEVPAVEVKDKAPAESISKEARDRVRNSIRKNSGMPRLAKTGEYKRADMKKALKYLRGLFGEDFNPELEDKLIEVVTKTGNVMAFGTFQRDCMKLSKAMEEGTEYHEAFHRVSLMYLAPEQLKAIYAEARKKYGYTKIVSDRAVNERLAEDYRSYELSGGKKIGLGEKIKNFFIDLYDFIRTWFTGRLSISRLDIDNLYRVMSKRPLFNPIRVASVNREAYDKLEGADAYTHQVKGRQLKYISTTEQLTNITRNLIYHMINDSGATSVRNISLLNFKAGSEAMERAVVGSMEAADMALAEGNKDEHDAFMYYASMYQEVLDNFDVFSDLMKDQLDAIGIRTELPEDPENENDNRGFNFVKYDKASFQLDSRDNAGTAVKYVIATLRANNEGNESTNLEQMVDYDRMYDTLRAELSEMSSIEEMVDYLKTKKSTPYLDLVSRIEDERKTDRWDTLATQFFHAMRQNKNSFTNALVDMRGLTAQITIADAESQKVSSSQAYVWGQAFLSSKAFKDGIPDANYLTGVMEDFKRIHEAVRSQYINKNNKGKIPDLKSLQSDLIRLFNKISVPMDQDTLDNILENISEDEHNAMYKFVVDTNTSRMAPVFGAKGPFSTLIHKGKVFDNKGRQMLLEDIFKNERLFTNTIAKAYIETKGGMQTNTILGPDGNPYYLFSENNYFTDLFHDFRTNDLVYAALASASYNTHSWIAEQMRDPEVRKNMQVGIFSSFAVVKASDKGRGFDEINDVEDLLLKMGLFESGHIVMPQLADRANLYHFKAAGKGKKGIQPIRLKYLYDSKNKRLVLPADIVQIFTGYAIDEYDQIRRTKKEIAQAISSKDFSKLRENFHYTIDKKTGEKVFNGNGLKWNHFTDFNDMKINNVNDLPALVEKVLKDRIEDAIDRFEEAGIIKVSRDKNGKVMNIMNLLFNHEALMKEGGENFGANSNANLAIQNKIANFTLNSIMATIEAEKLIFMSPAYYKDLDDKIKRYTAIASTGIISRLNIPATILKGERLLHNNDSFTSMVFATQKFSDKATIARLKDAFVTRYKKLGLTAEEANKRADEVLDGYNKVDQTDGQAYITPEMFRALHIRLGEWNDDKEEAYQLLEKDKLTLQEQQAVDKLFMQPLKFGYFGPEFGNKTAAPVYYKMSLATLTKQMAKDTQIEWVYDRMSNKANPVDMALFDTAVKVGASDKIKFYKTDENGNPNMDEIDLDAISNASVATRSFKYLRKQVVTDPHNELRSFVGTQFRKIALSNIDDNASYMLGDKKVTGQQLKEENKNIMDELSNRGLNTFLDIIGVDKDLVLTSTDKLYELLIDRARKSGMPNSFVDALADQFDSDPYELDALPDRRWGMAAMISMLSKKAVDLHLPGASLIQMSNFGIRNFVVDDTLKLIDDKGYMEAKVSIEIFRDAIPNYAYLTHEERVKFAKEEFVGVGYRIPTQGLASVVPIKIVDFFPATSTDTISLPAAFTTLTDSDFDIDKLYFVRHNYEIRNGKPVRVKYLDESNSTITERFEAFADDAIASDAKRTIRASYEALKDSFGDRKEFAALVQGEEDELFSMLDNEEDADTSSPEYQKALREARTKLSKDKAKERAWDKLARDEIRDARNQIKEIKDKWKRDNIQQFAKRSIAEQNTKKALENRLVDSYFSVLMAQDQMVDNYMPLSAPTSMLKSLAGQIAEWEGIERNYPALYTASFMYQSEVKHKYLWGKKGIGPFARANVHHILGQMVKLHLDSNLGVGNTTVVDGRTVTDLSAIYGKDNESILDWLSALVSGHVDIAKDAWVFNLNVNNATYGVGELLIRAGAGGKNTFLFLAQPILKEYAQLVNDARGKIKHDKRPPMTILKERYTKLMKEAISGEKLKKAPVSTDEVFDEKRLVNDIKETTVGNAAFYARQLQILQKFDDLRTPAAHLFEAVECVQIDTKRFGNNYAELRRFKKLVDKVLRDNVVRNMDKMFTDTFIGGLYSNSVLTALKLFKNVTIMGSDGVVAMHDRIMDEIGKRYDVSRDAMWYINTVSDEMYASIASRFFINQMNMTPARLEEMMFGPYSMATRMLRIKSDPRYEGNPFIQMLYPSMSFTKGEPDFIITFAATDVKTKWAKDRIIDGWSELLTSDNEEVREWAKDMVLYSFYTSGFRKGLYSVFHFIPPAYLKQIGFSEYIKATKAEFNDPSNIEFLESIHDDVFQNMWDKGEDEFVPHVAYADITNKRKPADWKESYPTHITVTDIAADALYLGSNDLGEPLFRPFIKTDGWNEKLLYKLVGYLPSESDPTNVLASVPIYALSRKKGYSSLGKVVKENGMPGSIIEENQTEPIDDAWTAELETSMPFKQREDGKYIYNYNGAVLYTPERMYVRDYALDDSTDESKDTEVRDVNTSTGWARKSENGYEVSSEGDSRFSALNARLKDGRTIEEAYQLDVKEYRNYSGEVAASGRMSMSYGSNKRPDVTASNTFDAIKNGERKATTRYAKDGHIDYWAKLKVGDVIEWKDADDNKVYVRVTRPLTKLSSRVTAEEWSKKEGWSVEYFNKEVKPKLAGAYQIEYELVNNTSWKQGKGKAPITNITMGESYTRYKQLWEQFFAENPALLEDLRVKSAGKVLTDKFASTEINQARAISEILNETSGETKTESGVIATNTPYTKATPNDKSKGFFFTENLQAYLANRDRASEVKLPVVANGVKLNVTADNNQAGIRTDAAGNRNDNAFAIISKKFQQNETGKFVKEEGQFQDTAADFELFKKYNTEAIEEALAYGKPLVISAGGIATGKSALPLRFAQWLNDTLQEKLGISGTIAENTTAGYKGYGITNLKAATDTGIIVTKNYVSLADTINDKERFDRIERVSSLVLNRLNIKTAPYSLYGMNEVRKRGAILNKELAAIKITELVRGLVSRDTDTWALSHVTSAEELERSLREHFFNDQYEESIKKQVESIEKWDIGSTNVASTNWNTLKEFLRRGEGSLGEFSKEQQELIRKELPALFKENKFKNWAQAKQFYTKHINNKYASLVKVEASNKKLQYVKRKALLNKYQTLLDFLEIVPDAKERLVKKVVSEYNRVSSFEGQEKYQHGQRLTRKVRDAGMMAEGFQLSRLQDSNNKYFTRSWRNKLLEAFGKKVTGGPTDILGKSDLYTVLNAIVDSGTEYADIAKHYLEYAKRHDNFTISFRRGGMQTGKGQASGVYSANIDKVEGNEYRYSLRSEDIDIDTSGDRFKKNPERLLLHEITHSLTSSYLIMYEEEQKLEGKKGAVVAFMSYITNYLEENSLYRPDSLFNDSPYGLSDPHEFIAEVMSNKDFQELLKEIPPMEEGKFRNLFEEILDFVLTLIGLREHTNAYEQALDVVEMALAGQYLTDIYSEDMSSPDNKFSKVLRETDNRKKLANVTAAREQQIEDEYKHCNI